MTTQTATIDESKLNEFMGRAVVDAGAALSAVLIDMGDKLGLYRAMADRGPVTSGELAEATQTAERYVREWLAAQAAGGYVNYDGGTGRYELPAEQALALAVEDSPVFLPGLFQIIASTFRDESKFIEAFRTGTGVGWHEHEHELFHGTERFFRPGYNANLVTSWIPALEGMQERLQAGALVADVGCGYGASTIIMALAYPRSRFVGFDYHAGSIEAARKRAEEAGVGDRVTFEVASAKAYPGNGYDLVAFFDCLHDMGDPEGAARHVLHSLAPDGCWMLVEPFANEKVEDNLNPVGRVFYSASTLICTPNSLSQEVGLALGAQASEAQLYEIATRAGFTQFRRATESAFNRVFDVRP